MTGQALYLRCSTAHCIASHQGRKDIHGYTSATVVSTPLSFFVSGGVARGSGDLPSLGVRSVVDAAVVLIVSFAFTASAAAAASNLIFNACEINKTEDNIKLEDASQLSHR